jgi:hypothetical protein
LASEGYVEAGEGQTSNVKDVAVKEGKKTTEE